MSTVKRNKKQNIKRLIFYGLGLFIIIYLALFVIQGINQSREIFNNNLPETYNLTQEDSSIFLSAYRSKLKPIITYNSKLRNSITQISYEDEYKIYKYKIDLEEDIPLSKILKTEVRSVSQTDSKSYLMISKTPYNYMVLGVKPEPVKNIYLTFQGDSITTIRRNDTIASFHLICNNLSIKYQEDAPIDIFFSGKPGPFGSYGAVPIDIIFLKRKKSIYFLLMLSKNSGSIPGDLLYNIINKQGV